MRRLVAIAATVGLLAVAGCSDLDGTDGKEWITGEGTITAFAPADRAAPVTASGEDLDGDELDLEDYRGQVVVLNVFATWCPPCRKEMPDIGELVESYAGDEDVAFLGINIRDASADNAKAFLRGYDVDLTSFSDPGSEVLLSLTDKVGPYSLPSTMVLDREGRLAVLVLGTIPGVVTMSDAIDDVLAEPRG